MDKIKNILEDKNLKKNTYSVPEDYFADLEQRLSLIPGKKTGRPWMVTAVSIAASLAVAVTAGMMLISKPSEQEADYEAYIYNSYPSGNPESLFTETKDYTPSQDDIIEYLINTGTNVEYLAFE